MALFQPNFTHTHLLNKDTHVDNFWCLISKYIYVYATGRRVFVHENVSVLYFVLIPDTDCQQDGVPSAHGRFRVA